MQPGTLIAGKYRVERVLGRGGMGLVVEATHLHLESRIALKFLDEAMANDSTAVARFTREAKASAQLKSEHVCRVMDFGVEGRTPYIVMELLTGTDLARLCKVRTLDVATAALYIRQACMGLADAHALRIVHRDLKPGNLFVTRRTDGSPLIKVLDFGVAKIPASEQSVGLTGTSNVVGSPGYLSPEQVRSSRTVDGRSDIWSLGVILYKLVSGRLPFTADSFADFALAISSQPTPHLPDVPQAFQAIVARCLEKDPANRFADVNALADALAPFAAQARGSAPILPSPADAEIAEVEPDEPQLAGAPAASAPALAPAKKTLLGAPGAATKPEARPRPEEEAATRDPRSLPTAAGTAIGVARAPGLPGELLAGTIVGEYRIEDKIGEGGMGEVYAAIHPLIGKKAAIKVISPELGADPVVVQRFVQEARSVNQIGHPNIVDVFAFGKLSDGRNYFVMEHLKGESLRARTSRMFIPLAEAIQIFDEISGALEAAHEKQIVHRDLKPDNVFLAQVRRQIIVKLLDFGIAKLAVGDGGMSKTSTGELIGTPAYLSPEQARGKNVDYRTDIYALGCMMFEIITGRLPFIAESSMDIVLMHITEPPQRPSAIKPELPRALDQLIFQMLDKEPDRRPSLAQVRNVFAELVASGTVPIEPGSGSTFRSELARGRKDVTPLTTDRRRAPSDAPTAIEFTPGKDTIVPAKTMVHTRRRPGRVLLIGVVTAAVLVPAVSIGVAMLRASANQLSRDAAVVAPVPTVAPEPTAVDAALATAVASPDAVEPVAATPSDAAVDAPVAETHAKKPRHVTSPAPHGKPKSVPPDAGQKPGDETINPF